MSGQFSGQVPNQAGTSLSGIPQQQNMMQNPGGQRSTLNMEPGFVKARRFIQERIAGPYKEKKLRQQTQEIAQKKVMDIVRRLEEGLFKTATTKEEYMNLETLETRLHILIKRLPLSNQNQQYQQQANTSVPMGTMIPNPGMPQSGNSNIMVPSSMDNSFVGAGPAGGGNSMMSSAVNTYAGGLNNGYQQPTSNFSNNSGGNSMISSMGAQRMASQMIPTPGFTNSTSTSNQSYMNMDSSNGVVGLSNIDSTTVSQPMQQKQQVGGQNSRILHSLGSHMGGGIRSTIQQKAYGFPSGSINNGLGINNMPMMNGSGTSESYVTASHYGNSSQTLPQHQQQMSQGDGYGSSTADSSRSGNIYVPTTSATSMMNNQNMNSVSLHSLHNTSAPMMVNQSNLVNHQQVSNIKPSVDQSEKMDFRSQQPAMNHFQDNSREDIYSQLHSLTPGSQGLSLPMTETSQQMQLLQQNQYVADTRNDYSSSAGVQPGSGMQGQWNVRSQEVPLITGNMSQKNVQEEFSQRIAGQDQAQRNNLSSEGSITYQKPANKSVDPPNSNATSITPNRELQFKNQQRWLLFLRHARKCVHPPGKCPEINCITAQKLLNHMESCNDIVQCQYPRCRRTKLLLNHNRHCRDPICPVCVPVKRFVQLKGAPRPDSSEYTSGGTAKDTTKTTPSVVETSEDLHPTLKRMKIEQPSQSLATDNKNPAIPVSVTNASELQDQITDTNTPTKPEVNVVKLEEHLRRLQQQSDSRRRAAVMEMMRQRAAEVAGSS
ncbi:histone acetyltransferase of the CBP family 1 [Artemisia annua]|uniref:histone acetyltransferase n=1 Tax=Artemisia annua TaxID=35608 RepID=A0A2U1P3G1_ARTAN|nr:histone acetyltransferase of the CBP family 1 [Artemisia annua]